MRGAHLARLAAAGLALAWPVAPPRSATPPPAAVPAAAGGEPRPPAEPPPPVILVTVDGVRFQEVFHGLDGGLAGEEGDGDGAPLLPRLRARAARSGFLTGDADHGDRFAVSNLAACSLPGYQSILSGRDAGCLDNACGRVEVETVLERARRELDLARAEVAVFASWPEIALAVERVEGALTVDAGSAPASPPPADAAVEAIRRADAADRPPWGYRRDRYTWALALRHLEAHRPRVLYVGLGDPDEWGHLGDYRAYAGSLRELDAWLEDLFRRLGSMGAYGAGASVLVTTDHGRGRGEAWTRHGFWYAGSNRAWLFASTPATRAAPGRTGRGRYDHHAIRPTLEALLGLPPCGHCRSAVAELLPPHVAARLDEADAWGAGGP